MFKGSGQQRGSTASLTLLGEENPPVKTFKNNISTVTTGARGMMKSVGGALWSTGIKPKVGGVQVR